jgi:hypothetical protein
MRPPPSHLAACRGVSGVSACVAVSATEAQAHDKCNHALHVVKQSHQDMVTQRHGKDLEGNLERTNCPMQPHVFPYEDTTSPISPVTSPVGLGPANDCAGEDQQKL